MFHLYYIRYFHKTRLIFCTDYRRRNSADNILDAPSLATQKSLAKSTTALHMLGGDDKTVRGKCSCCTSLLSRFSFFLSLFQLIFFCALLLLFLLNTDCLQQDEDCVRYFLPLYRIPVFHTFVFTF